MAYTTINKSTDYFNGATYLGSASAVTVSSLSFQPDLVWVKDRQNGNNHCLVDAVRGVGKYFSSNLTAQEVNSTSQSISSFTATGFVTGTANPANEAGSSSTGFISWNWKANGAGVANTAGTISSTVSANTTSGFSIVSYTGNQTAGATVGHGLGVKPDFMIVKLRSGDVAEPMVYHKSLGATKAMKLNASDALITNTTIWNDTEPTSTVFSVGTSNNVNHVYPLIAYCFAEKKGFSKFGSYTGNGSNDGTFVYTGFKPAFVMIKKYSTAGEDWFLWDNKRATFNVAQKVMRPNSTSTETDVVYDGMDILSNGFKLRYNDTRSNGSGLIHVYMAFAEQPLVGTNNVPCTAR